MSGHESGMKRQGMPALVLGAVGVVYGDIGTSPLYALKECFNPEHGIALNPESVLGILSMLFWSMILVVSIKYVVFVMRADNNGEGGILALMALALRGKEGKPRYRWWLMALGIFGAATFYGDSMITPAISVLSAVEGLDLISHIFHPYVLPITVGILIGLFMIQRIGTASVGKLFGPIMLLWFGILAASGIWHIFDRPEVLGAMSPHPALIFIFHYPWHAFVVLGSVFLVLTGGEALYADMGHFGRKPIQYAWFGLVMPALMLNYFGQGAFVLGNPEAIKNPFFLMMPDWAMLPMVALAACATVIASQAVISGAFSLTSSAIQMGYSPRMKIAHTSEREIGQIYLPFVNWSLLFSVLVLVLTFRSSTNLAAAYGIAVTSTMVITTLLAYVVMRRVWQWNVWLTRAGILFFLFIDLMFFGANALKIPDGGWVPLLLGGIVFTLLTTWKRGRELLAERLQSDSMPLQLFVNGIGAHPPHRVEGSAVFMTGSKTGVPHSLLHNLKHNKVLHERNVLLTVTTEDIPFVPDIDRLRVDDLGYGFWMVEAIYGFKEEPDIHEILTSCSEQHNLPFEMMDTSFFLTRETLIATKMPGMAIWREKLFVWMSKNATKATDFFKIPANRVVELGTQVEL